MSGDHAHGGVSAAGRHTRPLLIALALTSVYAIVEVTTGFAFDSLALISDAGHMLTDVVGLALALGAIYLARSRRDPSQTYGLYRVEMLAALANAALLFAVAGYVLYEASKRFSDPPDVPGAPLLVVAAIGLLVNVVSFSLLRRGAGESLNIRGAFLEVMSDLLGSIGTIVAGIVLLTTGWRYADPIMGAAIGLFILPRAYRLGRDAIRVLLEIAPSEVDLRAVTARLSRVPGVSSVHDLHVWTLTSGYRLASGHLVLADGADLGHVLGEASDALRDDFQIEHATLQGEPAGFEEPVREV